MLLGVDFGKGDEIGARELPREALIEGTYLLARLAPAFFLAGSCCRVNRVAGEIPICVDCRRG